MIDTPNLPGLQTRKARTKVAMKMRDEGMDRLKSLFGNWLAPWLFDTKGAGGPKRRKRVYDSATTFALFLL